MPWSSPTDPGSLQFPPPRQRLIAALGQPACRHRAPCWEDWSPPWGRRGERDMAAAGPMSGGQHNSSVTRTRRCAWSQGWAGVRISQRPDPPPPAGEVCEGPRDRGPLPRPGPGRRFGPSWGQQGAACGRVTMLVAQSRLTLLPVDCSLPGSSVHGILQARVHKWGASLFSRGSSRPWDRTQISRTAGRFFTI